MRIAYLAGPADGPASYRQWLGRQEQAYFGTDYLKQFLELAKEHEALVFTWSGERALQTLGNVTFDNRPLPPHSGLLHYVLTIWWHLRLLPALWRFKPDVLFLTGNQNYWWTLLPLRTEFLPSYHAVLWPSRVSRGWRLLLRLNRAALRRAKVIIATSRAIERQVRTLTDAAVILHLPTWEPEQFAGIAKPVWSRPFRIIFAARIEENKGIFDVLEIARRCPEFQFDVCGDGGALEKARKLAPPNVTFLGFCDRRRLQAAVSQAHVALVPTRADCEAGFEMTCAEAILSGRPLITSAVCPALEYLRPAALEVEPENIDQYVDALRVISGDRELYERLCGACEPLRAQFFDPANSWLTAAQKALNRLGLGSSSE